MEGNFLCAKKNMIKNFELSLCAHARVCVVQPVCGHTHSAWLHLVLPAGGGVRMDSLGKLWDRAKALNF